MKNNQIIISMLVLSIFFASCNQANTGRNASNTKPNTENDVKSETEIAARHIKIKSENSFDETYANLKKTIESKEPLTIIAELDHAANAEKAGMKLRPTKVIMFGNPKLGTPLMTANQEIGVDLPQKMLVYEDEKSDVYVIYNDPKKIAENHKISGKDEVLNNISEALKNLAEAAAKKQEQ